MAPPSGNFFSKLAGIISSAFRINATDDTNSAVFTVQVDGASQQHVFVNDKDGGGYGGKLVEVDAAILTASHSALATFASVTNRYLIAASFDASASVPNNTTTQQYLLCTNGDGAGWGAGDVAFDNGTGSGSVLKLGQHIGDVISINGNSVGGGGSTTTPTSFVQGGVYVNQTPGTFAQLATGTPSTTGIVQTIAIAFGFADVNAGTKPSGTTLPANAIILRSRVQVYSAFDNVSTMKAGNTGNDHILMSTTDNSLAATGGAIFSVEGASDPGQVWGVDSVVTLTFGSATPATTGNAVFLVEYVLPFN